MRDQLCSKYVPVPLQLCLSSMLRMVHVPWRTRSSGSLERRVRRIKLARLTVGIGALEDDEKDGDDGIAGATKGWFSNNNSAGIPPSLPTGSITSMRSLSGWLLWLSSSSSTSTVRHWKMRRMDDFRFLDGACSAGEDDALRAASNTLGKKASGKCSMVASSTAIDRWFRLIVVIAPLSFVLLLFS